MHSQKVTLLLTNVLSPSSSSSVIADSSYHFSFLQAVEPAHAVIGRDRNLFIPSVLSIQGRIA